MFNGVIIIFSALCLFEGSLGYNVAVVEYFYDRDVFMELSPVEAANKNARTYNELVEQIKHDQKKLDIVIFPEATLVAEPLDTPSGRLGMTFVPKPENKIIPCNSTDKHFADFFRSLSCTAKKFNTYLVINLKEKDDEEGVMKFYNTNVVFDRDGKVIARYRKTNLYLEPDTNRPDIPELITFDTDFGKTFGIFTCFDIIFKSPAMDLVRKGVKNFIFPTLWIPELPFLTSNQVQQMWAQGNDVVLLASGAAFPTYGSGALGIYLGNNETLAKAVTPRNDNFYIYTNVPEVNANMNKECSIKIDNNIAKEMDQYTLFAEDLSEYSFEKLDLTKSKILRKKLCQNGFCCNFDFEIDYVEFDENGIKKSYEYFVVIRNGLRSYGQNTYRNALETCGLIACAGPSLKDCGKRYPKFEEISWPIVWKKISVSAVFGNLGKSMQFPNSLLADFSPIPPTCTIWCSDEDHQKSSVKRTFSTRTQLTKILTFGIFGRNYDMDANEVRNI